MRKRTYVTGQSYGFGATAVAALHAGQVRTTRVLTVFVALLSIAIASVFFMLQSPPAEAFDMIPRPSDESLGLAAISGFVASTAFGIAILLAPAALARRAVRRRR